MKDKFVGIAKVGEKGQIVIPKEAREIFLFVKERCPDLFDDFYNYSFNSSGGKLWHKNK